jgi:hypothetical protein
MHEVGRDGQAFRVRIGDDAPAKYRSRHPVRRYQAKDKVRASNIWWHILYLDRVIETLEPGERIEFPPPKPSSKRLRLHSTEATP